MKRPKNKLEKAKEGFIEKYRDNICSFGDFWDPYKLSPFVRQLNNLIRLAKEEGRKGK